MNTGRSCSAASGGSWGHCSSAGSWYLLQLGFLPPTYTSESVILVEQPKVPKDLVAPNVQVDLADRVQSHEHAGPEPHPPAQPHQKLNLYPSYASSPDDQVKQDARRHQVGTGASSRHRGQEPGELMAFKIDYKAPNASDRAAGERRAWHRSSSTRTCGPARSSRKPRRCSSIRRCGRSAQSLADAGGQGARLRGPARRLLASAIAEQYPDPEWYSVAVAGCAGRP